MKQVSEACLRNQDPICKVLQQWFLASGNVLEIGAGTGQHAVYFARAMPNLVWLPTDQEENLESIREWRAEEGSPNLLEPQLLDVTGPWPQQTFTYIFTANTAHIMHWQHVEDMFSGAASVLRPKGVFCLYGPVNRNGEFTSDSNREFDAHLRSRDPEMGIRNDEDLIELGSSVGLAMSADYSMPARNRMLIWTKP